MSYAHLWNIKMYLLVLIFKNNWFYFWMVILDFKTLMIRKVEIHSVYNILFFYTDEVFDYIDCTIVNVLL
jgi:hypothetical protein